ncbi:ORF12 [Fowl aviadenovirus A]|nr:ORF12 [Fowl aviadenovirus A]WNM87354.1 ORF12 [Fowl aviadenovirus A]WNM87432.1 ORF12 [Fowl aviadenovirus A]WNM87471.1 ORF12 [Fowl aviadenovirus A]WNM87549.1 ORF12 [Fowl aviadenovirus A]
MAERFRKLKDSVKRLRNRHTGEDDDDLVTHRLIFDLQRNNIFTYKDWLTRYPQDAELFESVAPALLEEARKLYCSYGLSQTINFNLQGFELSSQRDLRAMLEAEGYNAPVAIYAIYLWMSAMSISRLCHYTNTLYVVGEPSSAADIFTASILRLFQFVLTANINAFDFGQYARQQDLVKMLYFPCTAHCNTFKDPVANQLLKGRSFTTMTRDGLVDISEKKCLVRLYQLPHPEHLPTAPDEHIILRFYEPANGCGFFLGELSRYIHRIHQLQADNDNDALRALLCENKGMLCSRSWTSPCNACHSSHDI